jgi:uroporphyrinogen-III decarboxylase
MEDLRYTFLIEEVAQRRREVGDDGIVTVGAPSSPLGMCVRYYMGVEQLGYAYHDHPRELRDLLEAIADKYYQCYRGIAETEADATINYDDTTTQAISPRMFRELEVPYLNKTAEILHAHGKFCVHHACGHVRRLLADFRATLIDGFDGPSPPPAGDTTVAQAREEMGSDIVLIVGPDADAIERGDPQAIRAAVRSIFEGAGSRRNLVILIAAPPGAPVGHLWLAVDEAKRWSRDRG